MIIIINQALLILYLVRKSYYAISPMKRKRKEFLMVVMLINCRPFGQRKNSKAY